MFKHRSLITHAFAAKEEFMNSVHVKHSIAKYSDLHAISTTQLTLFSQGVVQ